eukprot:gnl/Chilomastix_cuspidata/2245.p1 GENE.gnl/Chilomastix_cuspidata/2245~~gnl/Chilomastix_cuspidata/2245.p1  ORF type:complete len:567 (+),score=242.68 gnl/Chilomastix_cuspidata/2245:102-1703(+)
MFLNPEIPDFSKNQRSIVLLPDTKTDLPVLPFLTPYYSSLALPPAKVVGDVPQFERDSEPSPTAESFFGCLCTLHKQQTGEEIHRIPVVGGQNLDLKKLFFLVKANGGYNEVCKTRSFKKIANEMGLPTRITNIGHAIKKHYSTLILPVEDKLNRLYLPNGRPAERPTRVLVDPMPLNVVPSMEQRHEPPGRENDIVTLIHSLLPRVSDKVKVSLDIARSISFPGLRVALARWPISGIALVVSKLQPVATSLPVNIQELTVVVDTPVGALPASLGLRKLALIFPDDVAAMGVNDAAARYDVLVNVLVGLGKEYPALFSLHVRGRDAARALLEPRVVEALNSIVSLKDLALVQSARAINVEPLVGAYRTVESLSVHALDGCPDVPADVSFGQVLPAPQTLHDSLAAAAPFGGVASLSLFTSHTPLPSQRQGEFAGAGAAPFKKIMPFQYSGDAGLGFPILAQPFAAERLSGLKFLSICGTDPVRLRDLAKCAPNLRSLILHKVATNIFVPSAPDAGVEALRGLFPLLKSVEVVK